MTEARRAFQETDPDSYFSYVRGLVKKMKHEGTSKIDYLCAADVGADVFRRQIANNSKADSETIAKVACIATNCYLQAERPMEVILFGGSAINCVGVDNPNAIIQLREMMMVAEAQLQAAPPRVPLP